LVGANEESTRRARRAVDIAIDPGENAGGLYRKNSSTGLYSSSRDQGWVGIPEQDGYNAPKKTPLSIASEDDTALVDRSAEVIGPDDNIVRDASGREYHRIRYMRDEQTSQTTINDNRVRPINPIVATHPDEPMTPNSDDGVRNLSTEENVGSVDAPSEDQSDNS